MVPTVHSLVKIDPSSTENWKLLGYAYAFEQATRRRAAPDFRPGVAV